MAKTVVAQSLGTKFLLEARALDQVRAVVQAGGLIVYPTDTVYGLGADPFQEKAVDRVLTAKERPRASAAGGTNIETNSSRQI